MDGFERSSGYDRNHDRAADALEPLFPDDFSLEDTAFARELRTLYPIECEVLPPLYVQTIMDDPQITPPTPAEERTLVRGVFARLRVAREPLEPLLAKLPVLPSWPSLVETIAQVNVLSRSVMAGAGMLLAAMLFSILMTGPAFAQGLQMLLGHTGVQQVGSYPNSAQISDANGFHGGGDFATLTPLWLGASLGDYRYQAIWALKPEQWSKGPIVELQYARTNQTGSQDLLDIREFQISDRYSAVLQVVQAGAASEAPLDQATTAVYVDGAWSMQGPRTYWDYGARSELIFERGGIIFWIVADAHRGMDQNQLIEMARHLTPAASLLPSMRGTGVQMIGSELTGWLHNPSSGELYALVPAGASPQSGIDSLVLLRGRANVAGHSGAN